MGIRQVQDSAYKYIDLVAIYDSAIMKDVNAKPIMEFI
jgi:hypothetical protein